MPHIVYARKSSESEDRQVLSISAQLNELQAIADREGFTIAAVYEESQSAKASGRPVFNEMLRDIRRRKECSLLVWNIDRLARNMVDGGTLLELMDQGRIVGITTYEKTYRNTPDDKFMMGLSFSTAKKYVDDLSVNVKRGNLEKVKRGGWPNKPPFGYISDRNTKSIVIDPDRGRYVPRIFELYVTGAHGFVSISDIMYAQGLRTASGKKVLKGHIQKILSTRFYTGVMEWKSNLYKGNHEPLITKQRFDDAQAVMHGFARPRPKSDDLFFPMRGYVTCASCGCMYTATLKKGHHYYFCTNSKRNCTAHKKYLREYVLYDTVAELLKTLSFSESKIELMYQAAKARLESQTTESRADLELLRTRLSALPERESRLLDALLNDQITQDLYNQKAAELKHDRIDLQKQIEQLAATEPVATLEPVKNLFMQASTASNEFVRADELQKRAIVENLLWNLSIKDGKVEEVRFKTPFNLIANAPKNAEISKLLPDLESNQD